MSAMLFSEWRKLPVSLTELCLDTTLRCGQSFRWKQFGEGGEWRCSMGGRVLSLKQDSTYLHYRAIWPSHKHVLQKTELRKEQCLLEEHEDDTESLIKNYFNLGPRLSTLYEQWSASDGNFKKKAPQFAGIRILKQDPWEALIGFICSSNNNIARISQMVNNLCAHYGTYLGTIEDVTFHDFPSPRQLALANLEQELRQLGFGYRAKYLFRTSHIIADEKPVGWLESISNLEVPGIDKQSEDKDIQEYLLPGGRPGYRQAHEQLLELQGVGPKVADCVCLMGLGWNEALPVDTHVWQFAVKDYGFGKGKHKSLTKATYAAIGDHFRRLWGIEAGWAHSVLFAADLRTFAVRLNPKTEIDIEEKAIKTEEASMLAEQRITVKRSLVEDIVKEEPSDENTVVSITEVPIPKSAGKRSR